MSNYWGNKLKELEEEERKKKEKEQANNPSNYWQNKMDELKKSTSASPADDIAPVRENIHGGGGRKFGETEEENQKWYKGWLQKGAFADGYDFGDINKTILSTTHDLHTSFMGGIYDMGEAVVDAGAYLAGGAANLLGADGFADKMKDFAAKDLYDGKEVASESFKKTNPLSYVARVITGAEETDSLLGDKSDSLIASGGQLAATVGLQAVGVPWFVTTGVTSFGTEVEEAFGEDATYLEAGGSALISAGAEILTEKLSGGIKFGGKTLDDVLLQPLVNRISNKVGRTLVNLGIDAVGEGFEEVASEFISTLGKQLTYEKEDTWNELLTNEEAMDNYIAETADSLFGKEARQNYSQAFIGGMALGGGVSGVRAGNSIKTGRDYKTGLTANEQKVVDKEIENRIAKEEANGKKLTNKEKTAIEEEVKIELAKGGISIDTIESVLGGDTYKSYQDTIANEDALKKELDELRQMESGKMNDIQTERLAELKAMNLSDTTKRDSLKAKLSEEVQGMLTRETKFGTQADIGLIESYNERARSGEKFTADLKGYNEKQKAIVQKAIDSGILNNTNRSHEFVDMVARIGAEKNLSFDFANNDKLKESGFAVDGATINGFVNKDGVTVNINSKKALNTVVGHEITHVLEGTEFYTELQKAVTEYAKAKGDYQGRYDSLAKLYKSVEDADIDAELTADLVGDYLFTDSDFINNLSTKHRNVFQKIYDEVKYLCKVATAGSKEARQLEKVKKAFEDAFKADSKGVSGTKYSLTADSDGKQLTKEQSEYFKDSKMRDDNGNLKVMYHGTPNGDFTVFKDGTYFTDNKEYADRYQNPSASSISTGKTASAPKTFEVYLDIKKPFDISDAETRAIYINDYIKGGNALGINPYLSDAEYDKIETIDWTEGENLRDFLIENEYDFDGLVLDEGADGGYGEDVKHRGKSYVVFSPEQVKNTDNTNPTSNPDIRYSLTEDSESPRTYGNYNIFGEDIAFKPEQTAAPVEEVAPVREDVTTEESTAVGYETEPTVSKMEQVAPIKAETPTETASTLPKYAENEIASYKNDIAEERATAKNNRKPSISALKRLAVTKPKANETVHGVRVSDGKQYMSINGFVVAEMSTPDKSIVDNEALAVDGIKRLLDGANNSVKEGNYVIDPIDISLIRKHIPKDNRAVVVVEDNCYDVRFVDAVLKAIENPTISLSPSKGGFNLLLVKGNNGQALIAPINHKLKSVELRFVYRADKVGAEQIAPESFAPATAEDAMAAREASAPSLDNANVPDEVEAPYYEESTVTQSDDPFTERDYKGVGNKKVKAYMSENPEVRPYFQQAAQAMLGDLQNSTRGERWYNDEVYYESSGEKGFSGTKRHTTDDIAYLLDKGYSYAEIEKGLNAIIQDHGAENIAVAKRIEFALNDRLRNGYTDVYGDQIPPNDEYLKLFSKKQAAEAVYNEAPMPTDADAPFDDIAPVKESAPVAPVAATENIAPVAEPEADTAQKAPRNTIDKIIVDEPKTEKPKRSLLTEAMTLFGDKGYVFEKLAKRTKNRELESKYNFMHYSERRAQEYIKDNLKPLVERVEQTGKAQEFFDYVYNLHNIDRMSLETEENRTKRESLREQFAGYSDKQIEAIAMEWIKRDTPKDAIDRIKAAREYIDTLKGKNKPVFGDDITADVSREIVKQYEAENPEFKELAEAVVEYNNQLRKMLVDGNVISQETADLWAKMYPHYVPIRRAGHEGAAINVPLDTNKTGVNAPIKRATGGNSPVLNLLNTMATRTEQTFKAIAKNSFGLELMHTLDSNVEGEDVNVDEITDSFDNHEELLQEGKNGKNPTFTVFENGKRVTFEISEDMYDALKPTDEKLARTIKPFNAASELFRGLLTEYNLVFAVTNAVKDVQDVLINSQHPLQTYANIPLAINEMATKGKWYTERMKNGGSEDSYFDSETKTFTKEDEGFKKYIGIPLRVISKANNIVEQVPRLAEYMASRKAGASIETAMLDAARVTTNFAAGGDVTKFFNRNGVTFLNASVQGAMQQVRNVQEAKMNGLKGWAQLATKFAIAGLPALILNNLLWDDDEEYEELSDYIKQNYYVVAKYGDGKFVRIPKGRAVAVIQDAFVQMEHLITGDDEADLKSFLELFVNNLAPNNPLDNNVLAPFIQTFVTNKTWYGEDLVPTRLQDLPKAEQYDESTDAISKWLGEKLNVSPYKLNYLFNQISGGVGDMFIPMMTPDAESGNDTLAGKVLAPWMDKFTTDSTFKNQGISDFYDTKDKLTINANSKNATDEDILKSKYMNSVNSELSELYAQKREIQSDTSLSNKKKYDAVRGIQEQINELAKNGLNTYENIRYESGGDVAVIGGKYYEWYTPENKSKEPYWRALSDEQTTKYKITSSAGNAFYATDGTIHYRRDENGDWVKISDKQLARQKEVTKALGISPEEYWRETDISFLPMSDGEYEYAYENPGNYAVAKAVGGYDAYSGYRKAISEIEADKDENGNSISGSKKQKVADYINGLDIDYGEKIILYRSMYNSKEDRANYNAEILEYLNSRDDISYEDTVAILEELGFTVDENGYARWE